MPDSPPRSRQHLQIRQQWPRTAQQLEATYYPGEDWALSDSQGHNHAGYMLWALQRMATICNDRHAHKQFTTAELDLAASREVYYQWIHDRRFSHTDAALARCLSNIVIERPEKLLEARRLLAGQAGKREWSTPRTTSERSTAIPSSSPGKSNAPAQSAPTAYASPALTPPSYVPLQSQGQQRLAFTSVTYVTAGSCVSFQREPGQTVTAG